MKKELTFKTNINCNSCVAQVKPKLDEIEGIQQWIVDTDDKNKTLTVRGEELSEATVVEAVKSAGFKIEKN